MRFRAFALVVLLACASALPAHAQQRQPRPQTQPQEEQQLRGEPWYRAQLTELAEVLGGTHYLRVLCGGRGDQRWRDYMRGIIQREPNYNTLLVEAFNRGYRQEEARFSRCDPAAEQTEAELRARGLRVSQALRARNATANPER